MPWLEDRSISRFYVRSKVHLRPFKTVFSTSKKRWQNSFYSSHYGIQIINTSRIIIECFTFSSFLWRLSNSSPTLWCRADRSYSHRHLDTWTRLRERRTPAKARRDYCRVMRGCLDWINLNKNRRMLADVRHRQQRVTKAQTETTNATSDCPPSTATKMSDIVITSEQTNQQDAITPAPSTTSTTTTTTKTKNAPAHAKKKRVKKTTSAAPAPTKTSTSTKTTTTRCAPSSWPYKNLNNNKSTSLQTRFYCIFFILLKWNETLRRRRARTPSFKRRPSIYMYMCTFCQSYACFIHLDIGSFAQTI